MSAPVFLAWAERDPVLLPDENAEPVKRALERRGSLRGTRLVPGAGHYVFLAPCTAELAGDAARLCEDPVGVDRVAVHRELNAEIASFFEQTLKAP